MARINWPIFSVVFLVGIHVSQSISTRNIATIKAYLNNYQKYLNAPCTIHYLDSTFKDFGLFENEMFSSIRFSTMEGQRGGKQSISIYGSKLQTKCDILVSSSKFAQQSESKKIDKSMKNHLWIIDGAYDVGQFSWPVLRPNLQFFWETVF